MTDLIHLTDDELVELRVSVATEQERRSRLCEAPAQIVDLVRSAHAAGVPEADVRAAVDEALAEQP